MSEDDDYDEEIVTDEDEEEDTPSVADVIEEQQSQDDVTIPEDVTILDEPNRIDHETLEDQNERELMEDLEQANTYDEFSDLIQTDSAALRSRAIRASANRYSLFRNLASIGGKPVDDWTYKYVTPTERNCVVRQVTECASYDRIKQLRDEIVDKKPMPTASRLGIKLHDLVFLAHTENTHYRSTVGRLLSELSRTSEEDNNENKKYFEDTKDRIKKDLNTVGVEYAKFINKLNDFIKVDANIDYLYPESELSPGIVDDLMSAYSKKSDLDTKSIELRKSIVRDRVMKSINITPEEVEKDVNELIDIMQATYSQKPSTKRLNTLYQKRGLFSASKGYELMKLYVDSSVQDYKLFNSNYSGNMAIASINNSIDRYFKSGMTDQEFLQSSISLKTEIATNMKVLEEQLSRSAALIRSERYANLNELFSDFTTIELWKRNFGNMVWADIIPNPLVISTYQVRMEDKEEDMCHMFMWPDRIALSYDPRANSFITKPASIEIMSDFHDASLRKPDNFTFLGLPVQLSTVSVLREKGLTTMTNMLPNTSGSFNSADKTNDIKSWPQKDKVFLNDCGRTINPDHPGLDFLTVTPDDTYISGARCDQLEKIIRSAWLQYANKTANGKSSVLDDRVYCGIGPVEDISEEELLRNDARATDPEVRYRSEFTYYTKDFENNANQSFTGRSYLTIKVDISPHHTYDLSSGFVSSSERPYVAGHTLYLDMKKRGDKKFIWFKDRDKARKGKNSNKVEKDIKNDRWAGWFSKVVEIDALAENSVSYTWDRPEWALLLFKAIAGAIYEIGEDESSNFLLLVRLNKLKRLGDIRENVFVYILRKYFDFALAVHDSMQGDSQTIPPLYKNSDASGWYDYDFAIDTEVNLFSKIENDDIRDYLMENDETSPILFRAMPSVSELWKLFQLYFKDLFSKFGNNYAKLSVYDFMYTDVDMVSGNMKRASGEGSKLSKIFNKSKLVELGRDVINTMEEDTAALGFGVLNDSDLLKVIMQNVTSGLKINDQRQPIFVDTSKKRNAAKTKGLQSGGIAVSLWKLLRNTEKKQIQEYLLSKDKNIRLYVSKLYKRYKINSSRIIDFIDENILSTPEYAYPKWLTWDELYNLQPMRTHLLSKYLSQIYTTMDKVLIKYKYSRKGELLTDDNKREEEVAKLNEHLDKLEKKLTTLQKGNGDLTKINRVENSIKKTEEKIQMLTEIDENKAVEYAVRNNAKQLLLQQLQEAVLEYDKIANPNYNIEEFEPSLLQQDEEEDNPRNFNVGLNTFSLDQALQVNDVIPQVDQSGGPLVDLVDEEFPTELEELLRDLQFPEKNNVILGSPEATTPQRTNVPGNTITDDELVANFEQ
jgi:hypothetical protein